MAATFNAAIADIGAVACVSMSCFILSVSRNSNYVCVIMILQKAKVTYELDFYIQN